MPTGAEGGISFCVTILVGKEDFYFISWVSQVVLVVKNPAAYAGDTRDAGSIPSSGRCPGGGTPTHSHIFDWRIPWTEEPGGLQSGVTQSWIRFISYSGGSIYPMRKTDIPTYKAGKLPALCVCILGHPLPIPSSGFSGLTMGQRRRADERARHSGSQPRSWNPFGISMFSSEFVQSSEKGAHK